MYPRSPLSSPLYAPPALDRLPSEILLEVANYLPSRSDVLQLSQVSSVMYAKVVPALYATVDLHGAEQCERTLGMLQRCPDVARHIRRLAVHPEHEVDPRPHDHARAWDNAGIVSRCVMKLAPHLDALAQFEWDGEDMLPDDRMWTELRSRCPRLGHIGTTFGCFLPRPTSSLFQFTDLAGFSLTLKDGFYAHSLHLPSRGGSIANKEEYLALADEESESEPVFSRLWDMLILRCPNLESLRIVGNSSEPTDATRLYGAHWPKLDHLALGALLWNSNAPIQGGEVADFVAFLERHPTIRSLHLLGRPGSNTIDLSMLSPEALPNLKEFNGAFNLLRMLVDRVHHDDAPVGANPPAAPVPLPVQNANTHHNQHVPCTSLSKTLQSVSFPHAMHLRDLTPIAISRVLVSLHALTSVKVTFAIQGGYDSTNVFRTIVASCPHLLALDITCTNRPSFFLDAFANSLRGLSRLRTLSLSLVRMPGEEPMHIGASRIALANPRLKLFSISFIAAHSGSSDVPIPPLERGTFNLTCDAHGIPVCLDVSQRYTTLWPWQHRAAIAGAGTIQGEYASASAGLAEWFAAVAAALGIEGPMMLLESSVGVAPGGLRFSTGPRLTTSFGFGFGALVAAGLELVRGKPTARRWRYDLRPSGHPDVAQKGIAELLVERSPAGEEARLMTFCMSLMLLTVWALVSKTMR
ncbi:hypothetical protein C8Q80DRAFT_1107692 [Daedaleopsis nitida]|nr:hypothetical protein C8Q80DRAFT_1107692 [Daedaleopsis nitida]